MEDIHYLVKLCNRIVRKVQMQLIDTLHPWRLTSSTYPFLLALSEEEGVNLEKLSRKVGVDKAMATRSIQTLVSLGYVTKQADQNDSRAFQLYLTVQGHAAVPAVRKSIHCLIDFMTEDLDDEEKQMVIRLLTIIEQKSGSRIYGKK